MKCVGLSRAVTGLILLLLLAGGAGHASGPGAVSGAECGVDELPLLETSEAFEQYLKKPRTNLAKLLFGLNYFRTAPVMVRYDDVDYSPQFAYPLGLAYLLTHYRNEDPERWIKKNCYRSPTADKIMYFKFPDGNYYPVREVFIKTLCSLNEAESKRPQGV